MKSKHISRRKNTKRKTKSSHRRTKMRVHRRSVHRRSVHRRSIRRGSIRRGSIRRGSMRRGSKRHRRTRRSFYKLKGGSAQIPLTPGATPQVNPPLNQAQVTVPQPAFNNDPKIPIDYGLRQAAEQNRMAKLGQGGGGSCIDGVPHGKIEVPQFKTGPLDGNINVNTNMVQLATIYAESNVNATNDNLVITPQSPPR